MWAGLAVKFAGAVAGYNVRFDAYGGSADAGRYHNAGKLIAGQFHDGTHRHLRAHPQRRPTPQFVEELTGLVYAVSGTSRLGGFMVFTWMSFWGLVFCVKAAHHAIGGFATRRYAIAVFFFPSLVYWGSSIGKEAFVGLCLGAGRLRRRRSCSPAAAVPCAGSCCSPSGSSVPPTCGRTSPPSGPAPS